MSHIKAFLLGILRYVFVHIVWLFSFSVCFAVDYILACIGGLVLAYVATSWLARKLDLTSYKLFLRITVVLDVLEAILLLFTSSSFGANFQTITLSISFLALPLIAIICQKKVSP